MNFKQTIEKVKSRLERYRGHVLASLGAVAACGSVMYLQSHVAPGWVSFLAAFPALIIILVTVLARLDDIHLHQKTSQWQVRRLGLILAGIATVQFAVGPFALVPKFPSWLVVELAWGVALTWFTTPGMPPWLKYVTGEYKKGGKKND